eukprot:TRINITY_DN7601_c1_g1_i1.p2 TRINITY_DN7601_c1_g1~~TRINITY_DN7601_c1_g1_i1.p2  ORF type:complete len:284 (+),score=39.61 TRINITY_DN7601_c1_g1_i1:67-918(+)
MAHDVPRPGTASYSQLFANNRRWAGEKTKDDPNYFTNLAKGQSPQYLLIGCSDSRAPPDQLTQTQPGDIFIHRNVANLVVSTDMNFMSVLQYAVEVLKVKHVIVMGHYGCGGVKASLEHKSHGLIDKWLCHIKDVHRLHAEELSKFPEGEARLNRMIELNVLEQVLNLHKTSILQRAWSLGQDVSVHGWIFDIKTGLIQDMNFRNTDSWKEIEDIYRFDFADVQEMLVKTPALPAEKILERLSSQRSLEGPVPDLLSQSPARLFARSSTDPFSQSQGGDSDDE